MSTFSKTFWAALLAFVVANIVMGLLSFIFFVGMIAAMGGAESVTVKDNSILRITLEETISDSPASSPLAGIDFQSFTSRTSMSLLDVLNALESAAADSRIKGIYLNARGNTPGLSITEEMRAALQEFKKSGKFVMAYSDIYPHGRYFLASVADSVFMHPHGAMDWYGLSSGVTFFKGLLDKLDIEPIVLRHGSFKAAVEPFVMDKMSPENRTQLEKVVGSLWNTLVGDVAASRGLDSAKLQRMASELAVWSPEKAVELGFIDGLCYDDQMKERLNVLLDEEKDAKINFIALPKYVTAMKASSTSGSKNRVEVIYADGEIIDGKSKNNAVGGYTIAGKMAEARKDKRVKAVVLRVNSPGGSALASETMWREITLLKAEKPVVVSMGDMAASGGYYIACPADVVMADRMTVTGSIGVFGLFFNVGKGLKEKLGVTMDVVRTNPYADMGSSFRGIEDAERAFIMHDIERVYTTFVNHVAEGRNMTFEQVDAIGQGRIWLGLDAKEIGLVDGFGGLKDAIALAADRAGVAADYAVHEAVSSESPLQIIMNSLAETKAARMEAQLGEMYTQYAAIHSMLSRQGVQARIPYILDIK